MADRTLKLTIAYDGTRFRGWAAQPGHRTVQGELEAAFEQLCGGPVPLTVAGRTDAGVHAWAQVASAPWEGDLPDHLLRALNAITGADVAVTGLELVESAFDARRDALSRTYCYRVEATAIASPFEHGRALRWPYRVDRELLDGCAKAIIGQHDFTAFTPTQTEHVFFERTILSASWARAAGPVTRMTPTDSLADASSPQGVPHPRTIRGRVEGADDRILEFWVEADAFMRSMVRILVGTMLEVASHKRSLEGFERVLEGAPRERADQTAPAHGLYFAGVRY